MSERNPTMAEVIRNAVSKSVAELRVMLPVRVERVDLSKGLVDVQPLLKSTHVDESGTTIVETLPVITNCPIASFGAGTMSILFPVEKDDTGFVIFADMSLDVWLATGGVVDPQDERRHDISDAVFLPALRPFSNPWQGASSSGLVIGANGGARILFENSGNVSINGGSSPVAKVGSQVIAGPYVGSVTSGSSSVLVP